ncbi:MAG: ParA family protein [Oleispira sp.]
MLNTNKIKEFTTIVMDESTVIDRQTTFEKPNVRVISQTQPIRVLVANAKGGCGKTTMATNLASYFATQGEQTAIVDYDPQGSSIDWLSARDPHLAKIIGVAAFKHQAPSSTRTYSLRVPPTTSRIVLDTPAGLSGHILSDMIQASDFIVIPVIPSAIDIRAATGFIRDVLLSRAYRSNKKAIAVVANRVKKNTLIYQKLERFLNSLNIPFITSFRDTQHYVRASEHGLGLADFDQRDNKDKLEWQPMLEWIEQQIRLKQKK